MNCDDLLPALETGGFLRRRAARRHAAACPACARVLERWQDLKRALAAPAPLTDRERELVADAIEPRLPVPRAWSFRPVLVTGLAASLVLTAVVLSLRRGDGPTPPGGTEIRVASVTAQDVADACGPLEADLDRVERQIAALSERVQLGDVKRQAGTLLDQYRR